MDDFQQDFMRKVKTPTVEGEVVNTSGAPKKPIDKRWFIIGALILILLIALITLFVIDNANKSTATQPAGSYKSNILGEWRCDDSTIMSFYSDQTYIWTKNSTNSTDSGSFSEKDNVLSLERLAYIVNNDFIPISQKNLQFNLIYKNNSVSLNPVDESISYSCTRSDNE